MKDPILVRDKVLKEVDMGRLMVDYGVSFSYDPIKADEAQFRCPFHGADNKPSARYYRATQSCFCWYCKKRWDVIGFVRDKEKLSYIDALNFLVRRYNVDLAGIPDKPTIIHKQKVSLNHSEIQYRYIKGRLRSMRGKIPFEKYRALAGAYMMACYQGSIGQDIMPLLMKIESKINSLE